MMDKTFIGFKCSHELKAAVDVLSGGHRRRSAYLKSLIQREAKRAGIMPRMVIDSQPIRVREAAADEKT